MQRTGTEGLEAALEEAATGEAEAATAETEEELDTEQTDVSSEGEGKKGQTVPYSRFKEVNDKFKSTAEEYSQLEGRLTESNQSVAKLTELLESAKADSDVINDIRALALDPKHASHVEYINNVLLGIEQKEEEGEITSEEADKRSRTLLEQNQEALADELAEARADGIIARADAIADKWLEGLPEEYTEKDREVIAHLWTDAIDWDAVEEDPSSLEETLHTSFQEVIDLYDTPRGALVAPSETTEEETETEEVDPERELEELISGTEWAGMSTVKTPTGKEVLTPDISDDEFKDAMATVLKVRNAAE